MVLTRCISWIWVSWKQVLHAYHRHRLRSIDLHIGPLVFLSNGLSNKKGNIYHVTYIQIINEMMFSVYDAFAYHDATCTYPDWSWSFSVSICQQRWWIQGSKSTWHGLGTTVLCWDWAYGPSMVSYPVITFSVQSHFACRWHSNKWLSTMLWLFSLSFSANVSRHLPPSKGKMLFGSMNGVYSHWGMLALVFSLSLGWRLSSALLSSFCHGLGLWIKCSRSSIVSFQ